VILHVSRNKAGRKGGTGMARQGRGRRKEEEEGRREGGRREGRLGWLGWLVCFGGF